MDRRILQQGVIAGKNYTVQETADLLRISVGTLYNLRSRGKRLPRCFKVGNKVLYNGKAILDFIDDGMVDR